MNRCLPVLITLLLTAPALAAGAGGGNPFTGAIYQSVAAGLVFLLLLFLLKKMAWGPILTGLQDRENKIKGDLEKAESAAAQAAATLAQYQKELAQASEQARQMIDKARGEAEQAAATIRQQHEQEMAQLKQRAAADIKAAKEQAVNELYAQAAVLSTQIAGRILQREINAADQQKLVDEAVAELQKTSNN